MIFAHNHDHYFVDEAGDLTLFDRLGRLIVGQPGVSIYFMLATLHLPDPLQADKLLSELRSSLQNDPYFKGVPSMQPDAKKTALCFHAKNDLPEVRREVFRILSHLNCTVHVAIRDKRKVAQHAKNIFQNSGRKLHPNEIYDDLVQRAFYQVPRAESGALTAFARRGKRDRLSALAAAIPESKGVIQVAYAAYPHECAGLQIVDYYLWALQRLFERAEDRFFQSIAHAFARIVHVDDVKKSPNGEVFHSANPLTIDKIEHVTG